VSKRSLKIPKGQTESIYIEEEQTTQWPNENVQKDKQRFTKHTDKTKDRVTRTLLKTGGEPRWSGKVSSSCSTSGTCAVNIVANPVISREWGKVREVKIPKSWLQHYQKEPLVQYRILVTCLWFFLDIPLIFTSKPDWHDFTLHNSLIFFFILLHIEIFEGY